MLYKFSYVAFLNACNFFNWDKKRLNVLPLVLPFYPFFKVRCIPYFAFETYWKHLSVNDYIDKKTLGPSWSLIWGVSPFYLISNRSFNLKHILFNTCLDICTVPEIYGKESFSTSFWASFHLYCISKDISFLIYWCLH